MANLIITIISIALVGVTAIAGIWYGGSAFQEAQAKAHANRLINTAEQVASAWRLYALDHGGSTVLTDECWGNGADDLVPTYLSELPNLREVMGTSSNWQAQGTFGTRALTGDTVGFDATTSSFCSGFAAPASSRNGLIVRAGANRQICQKVVEQALGFVTDPILRVSSASDVTPRNGVYDCYYTDANSNLVWDSDEPGHFIYKVF